MQHKKTILTVLTLMLTGLGIILNSQHANATTPYQGPIVSLGEDLVSLIQSDNISFPMIDKYCPITIPDGWITVVGVEQTVDIYRCNKSSYTKLATAAHKKMINTIKSYEKRYPDMEKRIQKIKTAIDYAQTQRDATNNIKKKFVYDWIRLELYNYIEQLTNSEDDICEIITCDDSIIATASQDRYRKIYSRNYSLSKKSETSDTITYKICLASDNTVCIDLLQYYGGTFEDYYKTYVSEDGSFTPLPQETVEGRVTWSCANGMADSRWCYTNTNYGSLIMNISDAKGEGFHGGEYDPKEILKVIGFDEINTTSSSKEVDFGYVTSVYSVGSKSYLTIDYINYGKCLPDMSNCPSGAAPIINNNTLIRTFEITANADIEVLTRPNIQSNTISLNEFKRRVNNPYNGNRSDEDSKLYYGMGGVQGSVVRIKHDDKKVYSISEEYRP